MQNHQISIATAQFKTFRLTESCMQNKSSTIRSLKERDWIFKIFLYKSTIHSGLQLKHTPESFMTFNAFKIIVLLQGIKKGPFKKKKKKIISTLKCLTRYVSVFGTFL